MRKRLVTVESDKATIQDRLERLERTAKRPRVEPIPCPCGNSDHRNCSFSEWLHQFALADVSDFAPEVRNFVNFLDFQKRQHAPDTLSEDLYQCLVTANDERTIRILRRIAAATLVDGPTVSALIEGVLVHLKRSLHANDANSPSDRDVVRLVLQGAAAAVWTKRTAAEIVTSFITLRRDAPDAIRTVLGSNETGIREVLIENTDGRDLNLLWGPSLQAVLNFFIGATTEIDLRVESSCHEAMLSRWNDVRTTVEDLQDHASFRDAESAILLERTMTSAEVCYEVAVRKALMEKVGAMVEQAEKVEKMVGLVASLMGVLRSDEATGMKECARSLAKSLISLACANKLAKKATLVAIRTAVQLLSWCGNQALEDAELRAEFQRFLLRDGSGDDARKTCEELRAFLTQNESVGVKREDVCTV